MTGCHAYYDVETTGLVPGVDHIIEVGAVYAIDGRVVHTFNSLCNPGVDVVRAERSRKAFEVNGIDPAEVLEAQSEEFVAGMLRLFEQKLPASMERHSFNNGFDKGFLSLLPWGLDEEWGHCVMLRATRVLQSPGGRWLSLDKAAKRLELEWDGKAHRAGPDAMMAFRVDQRLEELSV